MQLSKLYANDSSVFSTIDFNCRENASVLNVVYGAVTDSADEKRDSHNLGKTTLVHLIDFMFLKDITGSNHFLATHKERFQKLVFYFEIALNDGDFLTVKRSVEYPTEIALKRHSDRGEDFSLNSFDDWDHSELSLTAARELLDGIFNLTIINPYEYRKALTYFLRTQEDYSDVLQLQKFTSGQHLHWKPFVMNLLGFDEGPSKEKYSLDKKIESIEAEKKKKEAELQVSEKDLLRLAAEIQNLKSNLSKTEIQLDQFEFSEQERRLMNELVDVIETRISELNDQIYNVKIDLRNIDHSINNKIKFRINDVKEIFDDVDIHFPDQIRRSYEDLVEFNNSLTRERNTALRGRRKELQDLQSSLREELLSEDKKRSEYRSILKNSDTLDKFKSLQRNLGEQRAELSYLEKQQEKLNAINVIELEINDLKRKRSSISDEIKMQISKSSALKEKVASNFNDFCKRILDHEGLFYLDQNNSGNVEFKIELKEAIGTKASRQSEGKSYKQLLCALFDLSILAAYQEMPFYHFVYHDGILEGLDDRKKKLFLGLVSEITAQSKIQYILSVIDSDIPRDANGARIDFSEDEIILRLHDGGNDGRLFKMAEF